MAANTLGQQNRMNTEIESVACLLLRCWLGVWDPTVWGRSAVLHAAVSKDARAAYGVSDNTGNEASGDCKQHDAPTPLF